MQAKNDSATALSSDVPGLKKDCVTLMASKFYKQYTVLPDRGGKINGKRPTNPRLLVVDFPV